MSETGDCSLGLGLVAFPLDTELYRKEESSALAQPSAHGFHQAPTGHCSISTQGDSPVPHLKTRDPDSGGKKLGQEWLGTDRRKPGYLLRRQFS